MSQLRNAADLALITWYKCHMAYLLHSSGQVLSRTRGTNRSMLVSVALEHLHGVPVYVPNPY